MLPSMVAEVGGAPFVAWTVSLYEIGSILAGAVSAYLTMRLGLRGPMAGAALLFAFGCALCAVAPTMPLVLIARLLQGLGGGAMVAIAFVAVGVWFPKRFMPRTLAAMSLFWGASAFLGPLIGGLFVDYATWRLGFWFFALLAAGLCLWILLAAKTDDDAIEAEETTVPLLRLLILAAAVLAIAYAGVVKSLTASLGLVLLGSGGLLAFLMLDGRSGARRLLPQGGLALNQASGAALVMILTLTIATIAITAYGPILMIQIHGISALTAGYIVAASSVGWTITMVAFSGATERWDRPLIVIGVIVTVFSIVGFAYAVPRGPIWLITLFAGLEGGGFGLAWTFILRHGTAQIQTSEHKRFAAAMPTIQRLGYASGAAYIGIVANALGFAAVMSKPEAAGIAQSLFLASLPFSAVSLVAMALLVRRR